MKGAWTLSMQNESAARGACILAFDTANEVVAVGVGRVEGASIEPLACREIPAHRASNTILLNEVDATFAEAGVSKGDVAAVVCGRGPGSFTGVRICMATAKGAASALEVPLYGVSTLDAVAWRAWAEGVRGRVLVAADAMRKEVYPALFEISDSEISRLTTDAVVKAVIACEWVADQEAKLPERVGDLTILGDALVKYREIFEPLGAIVDESLWAVSGAGLLLAAQAGLVAGDIDLSADAWHGESNAAAARANAGTAPVALRPGDPSVLLPVYTRLSDAEENERIRLAKEAPEKTDALSPRDLSTGVQHANVVSAAIENRAAVVAEIADVSANISYRPLDAAPRCRRCRYGTRMHGKRCVVPVSCCRRTAAPRPHVVGGIRRTKARWLLRRVDRRWPGANSENRYRPIVSPSRHCRRAHRARRFRCAEFGRYRNDARGARVERGRPGVLRKARLGDYRRASPLLFRPRKCCHHDGPAACVGCFCT